MKSHRYIVVLAAVCFCMAAVAQEAEHPPHWGYSGEAGPEHWGDMESDFEACSSGRNQSPVDLRSFIEADLPPIGFAYAPGGNEVVNNGHAIQVNYSPGSSITIDSTEFALKQFHFHTPSENTISGKSFPMEGHFVHADAKGNLAVVALMFEVGDSNKVLEQVWPKLPSAEGKQALAMPVAAADLLPANRDYYRYSGSLTTPPCSEGVLWVVLKQPVQASREQVDQPGKLIGHPNNRPVQPVGARPVLQ